MAAQEKGGTRRLIYKFKQLESRILKCKMRLKLVVTSMHWLNLLMWQQLALLFGDYHIGL